MWVIKLRFEGQTDKGMEADIQEAQAGNSGLKMIKHFRLSPLLSFSCVDFFENFGHCIVGSSLKRQIECHVIKTTTLQNAREGINPWSF
jgi:hypothetical protein